MGEREAQPDKDNTVRNEGNAAHWLVEQVFKGNFEAVELIDRKAYNGEYITSEMVDYVEDYIEILKSSIGGEIEFDTSYSGQNWTVNGRADNLYYNPNGTLIIRDLKYGYRLIEPEKNWILISHAVGFILKNPDKIVGEVVFEIHQPRQWHHLGTVRTANYSVQEIREFSAVINNTLSSLNDELHTGSHCINCPAVAHCHAARKAELNAIDASATVFDDNISNENLDYQLDNLGRAMEVLKERKKAFEELAIDRIKSGAVINNYDVETALSNRAWKKGITPAFIKNMSGIDVSQPKLITPKQAENAGVNKEFVKSLTTRHNKGVKLVRVDANKKAQKMFKTN